MAVDSGSCEQQQSEQLLQLRLQGRPTDEEENSGWRWRRRRRRCKSQDNVDDSCCEQLPQLSSAASSCRSSSLVLTRRHLTSLILLLIVHSVRCFPHTPADAGHITANAGDDIAFNCDVDFPGQTPVAYVVQWFKKGKEQPIYIWYDNYPTHADKEYEGRVSIIKPGTKNYGLASLNISNVTESDRGWYNCKVLFFNREPPEESTNGTWYHLDVHAPPYWINKPEEIVYVNLHDSIILQCHAGGTPTPEMVWYKGTKTVQLSPRTGVFNDGTELRINHLRSRDLGEYTCVARNGVGGKGTNRIHFTTRVVMAGGAVITKPPTNQTVQEGQGVEFPCEGQASPKNVSIKWFKDGRPVETMADLDRRTAVRKDGTLVFAKVSNTDEGRYTCKVTNGIGAPIEASAHLAVEYAARVSFHPDVQYIPRGLQGVIRCHIESNPAIQFVTWTKNKRIFDPFEEKGVMAIENGSIVIDKVGPEHIGDYVCTPYNIHGTAGASKVMHVKIKNPPEITRRPDQEYHRSVGDKITMPCGAVGNPMPDISWRRVDGRRLPRGRHKTYNGELTLDNLRKSDHGVYECVVTSDVASVSVRTELFIERTTPHAPTNVSVTSSETFSVTIEWLPGYSGCSACKQTYKIRYREKDSKFPNWIELPVNPPDARRIQIHHLSSRTRYEFQVIGTNEYGDGMYSEIIEAQTKDDGGLEWSVYAPTASPSEQSTSTDCDQAKKKGLTAALTATRKLLSSDCIEFNLEITGVAPQSGGRHEEERRKNDPNYSSYFDINLLPKDIGGNVIFPRIPKEKDTPPGEAPKAAFNLTVKPVAGGWVLKWLGDLTDTKLQYYTAQIRGIKDTDKWIPLTDSKIDKEEASYLIKNLGTGKGYKFRVLAHSTETFSISKEIQYNLPDDFKKRAVTAGLTGGILFFIVAIVLSVCTVKICNKRRRRKQERAYNMVACRLQQPPQPHTTPTQHHHQYPTRAEATARNGAHLAQHYQQVPLIRARHGKSRVPAMRTSNSRGRVVVFSDEKARKNLNFLNPVVESAAGAVRSLRYRVANIARSSRTVYPEQSHPGGGGSGEDSDAYYSDGGYRRRREMLPPPQAAKKSKYSLHVEYPTQPGHRGLISRSKDGKFILDDDDDDDDDDGGFGVSLPPNRFRTRSVAIVAGYSPERLYSNMPPGAHVVESGVYQVGAERSEPIYWRQLVYGASVRGASSDGSGTLPRPQAIRQQQLVQQPRVVTHQHYLPPPQQAPHFQATTRQVSHLGDEDLRRLRALEPQQSTASLDVQAGFDPTASSSRLIRTSNLELLRPTTSTSKLRSSSPLNQQHAPLQAPPWASPIGAGNDTSELSSIAKRERSLPSTLLTNPLSSVSTLPNLTSENTTSTRSLRSAQQRSNDLQTIQEEPPPSYSTLQDQQQVRADVHPLQHQQQLQQQQQQRRKGGKVPQQEDPYFQRPTYLNADAMFPNYALNYPAPIHHVSQPQTPGGTISPSRQYPPVEVPPDSYWQSLYVQPDPRDFMQYSSPPPSYSSPTHDYENTRYLNQQQQRQGGPPLPAPRRRPRAVSLDEQGSRRHRESTVIDGRLVQQQQQHRPSTVSAPGGTTEDQTSLVSEVLDAEVTALTNSSSSPGSDKGGAGKANKSGKSRLEQVKERLMAAAAGQQQPQGESESTSSGIASKNTSQHQTSSSSGEPQQIFLSPDSKAPLEPIFDPNQQPFYENWPPTKDHHHHQQPQHPQELNVGAAYYHGYHYMQPLSIATAESGEAVLPPLTPHQTSGMSAKPQMASARRIEAVPTHLSDTASVDTPPSRGAGVDLSSRPGSAHSAPMLDVSIDRHYEFDARPTPTDDLAVAALDPDAIRQALPRQWNRPYLGYNPRARERELGRAAQLAKGERVFSDSEIYSPVFPRGRPEKAAAAEEEVLERVRAMKREFQEYREQQQQQQHEKTTTSTTGQQQQQQQGEEESSTQTASADASKKLESLI